MRPNRILFPTLSVGNHTATLRALDFRVGLGERLAVVSPAREAPRQIEVCAVCGDMRDPAVGFCGGCGSRERVRVSDEQLEEPCVRLTRRVAQSVAAASALQVQSPAEPAPGATAKKGRVIFARLGSQRRLLRDRLLAARTAEERELYQHALQDVERVLGRDVRGRC